MFKKGDLVKYNDEQTPGLVFTSDHAGKIGTVMTNENQGLVWVKFDNLSPRGVMVGNLTAAPVVAPLGALNDGARIPSPLPNGSKERKEFALCSGLFDYFPAALAAVARHSFRSNEKHNPGEPVHWSRSKSNDHLDAALRHVMERDLEGAAWRILAALQMQLEQEGAPVPPNARDEPN